MEKENVYLFGSTVRLFGEFYNILGVPTDVNFPKIIIYDYKYNKIQEVNLTNTNKSDVGKYFFDLVLDHKNKRIIYEFNGEIDGLPALDRNSFTTKFI